MTPKIRYSLIMTAVLSIGPLSGVHAESPDAMDRSGVSQSARELPREGVPALTANEEATLAQLEEQASRLDDLLGSMRDNRVLKMLAGEKNSTNATQLMRFVESRNVQQIRVQLNQLTSDLSFCLRTPRVSKHRPRCDRLLIGINRAESDLNWMSDELRNHMARVRAEREQMDLVRNKRQEYQTAFENFDQKTNQLFNILSTVLKSMKDMQGAVTRNML